MKNPIRVLALALLLPLLAACRPLPAQATAQPQEPTLALYLLPPSAVPQPLETTGDSAEALQSADLSQATLVIQEADIVQYAWQSQELTLSAPLFEQYRQNPALIPEGSTFVMAFGERRLFGGLVVDPLSARYLTFPVLMVLNEELPARTLDALRLLIMPSLAAPADPARAKPFPAFDAEAAEQVRRHLEAVGKLVP